MWTRLRATSEAIQALPGALHDITALLSAALSGSQNAGELRARVQELEHELRGVEARAEALVTKAESTFQATRASEERTRHAQKRLERAREEFSEGDEAGPDPFEVAARAHMDRGDGGGGDNGGVPAMHQNVESGESSTRTSRRSQKASARRAKLGY